MEKVQELGNKKKEKLANKAFRVKKEGRKKGRKEERKKKNITS